MSAFYNVAPENKLRVIAPDVGGGFGSKIYIYPEEITCLWASKKTGVPVKWTSDRTEAFLPTRMAAIHVSKVKMAFDANHRVTALKVDTPPISAPTCRSSRQPFRPISMRRCSPASTICRPSMRMCMRSTPTPHRSMPIAAPAVRKPPICWNARWKRRRANWHVPG